jgi:osmotically-inducible protein OsmY
MPDQDHRQLATWNSLGQGADGRTRAASDRSTKEGSAVKSDSELRQDVQAELGWEPSFDERRIGVAVKDAVVTLTGEVGSFAQKWNAERAVERVNGVRGVANDLEVPMAGEHSDPEIAGAAADALRWNTLVLSDRITPEAERREAERVAWAAPGVSNLRSNITTGGAAQEATGSAFAAAGAPSGPRAGLSITHARPPAARRGPTSRRERLR